MFPQIFTGQPAWLILLCLSLAGLYSTALYYREKKSEFPLYLKIILGSLRFISVFLISFMLLSPFTRSIIRDREKPAIILAVDDSESVLLNKDSSYYRQEFAGEINELAGRLSDIGDVRIYHFSDGMDAAGQEFPDTGRFRQKITDISSVFSEIDVVYDNRNVGAMILVSDGIYNTGSNPVYQARNRPYPLYTVALGDTSTRMDLLIARVNYNRMVYLNNQFPIEVVVRALEMAGKKSRLRILRGNSEVFSTEIDIDRDDYTRTFQGVFEARETGLQKYVILLEPAIDETLVTNNRKEIYLEVLDARNKVLILAAAPHPDISALRQAISANLNYEVEYFQAGDFSGNLDQYNLVILHQLPSRAEPASSLLNALREKEIPALFIAGTLSDIPRLNQYAEGVKINMGRPVFEEAVPVYSKGFTSFSLGEPTRSWLAGLPPLLAPLADYQVSNSARVLLNQRLGNIETSRPLMLFSETTNGRKGLITGEGIWKWRMYDYARNQGHEHFNELINKTVQYLSLKEQKKSLRVYHPPNFRENDPVIMDAEVYDESFELVTDPEIEITISNEEGKQFPYVFSQSGNSYRLDAGKFPPGNYSWSARAEHGSRILTAGGQFSVSAIDLEALNTIADHHLLSQLARENGGDIYYPGQLDRLAADIRGRDDIKPVIYTRKKFEDLLNEWWLLALIAGLLSLEWFIRKRAGSY